MSRNWLAVASAEHVRWGKVGSFMQVCHGKRAPLQRIKPSDRVVYYSPTATFRGKDKLQAFTAIGIVKTGEPYMFDMGNGFCPYRRDVTWFEASDAFICPLLANLSFSVKNPHWGYLLRFGIFELTDQDMNTIATAMSV